jgi:CheY-like chemotaxis protein
VTAPRSRANLVRILLADDSRGIRDVLAIVLTGTGFEVALAEDGKEALDHLLAHPVDVLVTDIFMPRMDGIALIRAARAASRDLKIIAMSGGWAVPNLDVNPGLVEGDVLEVARRVGADRTFEKPVAPNDLVAAIRSLL